MKKASWFFWALVSFVWLIISLPFTDYSLISLLDIPDSPPRSQDGLWKLLQNITYAANSSILSALLLCGLNRGWYLGDGNPKFLSWLDVEVQLTKVFQKKLLLAAINVALAVLTTVSFVLLFLHGRILGRGLGYW